MSDLFFQQPILNSPYVCPSQHWQTDDSGQPTGERIPRRRPADFITPIPRARKNQAEIALEEDKRLSSAQQKYEHSQLINSLRHEVALWRALPEQDWKVTLETARLLKHWRHHSFAHIRPFFCQVEALETVIWLHEVAPKSGKKGRQFLEHLQQANQDANPGLARLALKLATGAGKTTVMAMLIAWQTINAVRYPRSQKFTKGFLIVAPGITIKDRLRVLLPNDPGSYYQSRELVPRDLLPELNKARIVITNYHAFKQRERLELAKGTRRLLQGAQGAPLQTQESEGQMLARVMPQLAGLKNIWVINDEAHHCYREKPQSSENETLNKEQQAEAQERNEAARLWISGLEAAGRHFGRTGQQPVIDLSATPFFLAGSGYREGTLFPWTLSDFSLWDAIESGIVKLPRVPVADNIPTDDMPRYRNLWQHIGTKMPKKGRSKSTSLDPLKLPLELQTALEALYGNYVKTFDTWQQAGTSVPPCLIVVCNNTATSKLVFDYIAGFTHEKGEKGEDSKENQLEQGRLPLFRNYDEHGQPLGRPRTLLVDSQQLESGEALGGTFRELAADEIERFKRHIILRTKDTRQADNLSDADVLREVMNTVGKPGRLGEHIRCVVSVSMLTEGWDANNVTHILGVRAFGTQLLCEQVMGRALRRQSYELNEHGLFNVEYADILGIPFDFTAQAVIAPPTPPVEVTTVKALHPERDHLEIRYPRVQGYRVELPGTQLQATFSTDHHLKLTPEIVGPTRTDNAGIIGEAIELGIQHLDNVRQATLVMALTKHLLLHHWREQGKNAPVALFGQLQRIVRQWLHECLTCQGSTYPAQLLYAELTHLACQRITHGITEAERAKGHHIKAILDAYNPSGSTQHVRFTTSRPPEKLWHTAGLAGGPKNPVNWVILDSTWEAEFCRVAETHPKVLAYTKNHNLGLEVPYRLGTTCHVYLPDFIVLLDDGHGPDNPLHLIVEIKGYRGQDAQAKAATMHSYWIPGVNHLGTHGRWAFVELTDINTMQESFAQAVEAALMCKHV